MALARTRSVSLDGMRGRMVDIEVDISGGLPATVLVGLPDASLNESRDRCRAAVVNSGHPWPQQKVTINLSPADMPKSGAHFDLGIALAVLAANGLIPADTIADAVVLGELGLDGRLRAVAGVLPAVMAACAVGWERVVVPEANVAEAAVVDGARVLGVRSLRHAAALLSGDEPPDDDPPVEPLRGTPTERRHDGLDLADVRGQEDALAAVVVAAAGGHHLLMTGPPGVGKTMLAQRLPGLLPDLDDGAALETSAVHSIAGLLPPEAPVIRRPPFLDPHHTASSAAIVGGGSRVVRPGVLSLAHHGCLFMDEAPEFRRDVLDALRQPLESGRIVVSRAARTAEFPARFQLVMAANPCPCGQGGGVAACACDAVRRRRYAERLSGPVRDRIDLQRGVRQVSARHFDDLEGAPITTAAMAARVAAARERQARRLAGSGWRTNAEVPGAFLRRPGTTPGAVLAAVGRMVRDGRANPRTADRLLRVAWTVADLRGAAAPDLDDLGVASVLRRPESTLTASMVERIVA